MADRVDRLVGARLRLLRNERGLSQQAVGEGVGLSFQQIQKYESGVNRISASVLAAVARFFGVPINTFFIDVEGRTDQPDALHKLDVMDNAEVLRIARAFTAIQDKKLRYQILNLVESLGRQSTTMGQPGDPAASAAGDQNAA